MTGGSILVAELQLVTEGLHFPEGPIAMDDGSVVLVENQSGTLARVAPDGTTTRVATTGGGPNGAAVGPDGKIYVCNNGGFEWAEVNGMAVPGPQPADYIGGRIQRVDINTGAVEDLYTECDGFGLRGPNDIVFDDKGGFYFTDLGKSRARDVDKGGVYYALADGSSIKNVVYGTDHANGISLSPDGNTLYIAETLNGRLWSWEIESPGVVKPSTTPYAPGNLLYNFEGFQLLDSMAVDSEGNICVATLITGAISVVSPKGKLIDQIKVPKYDVFVTNICFGGPDMRTAYITASGFGLLYKTEWHCPGLRLNYNA
jgi:gluconolactonase